MTADFFPDPLSAPADSLASDLRAIACAMALLWTYRPRTTLLNALRLLGYKRGDGRAFTAENIKELQQAMREQGHLLEHPTRQGHYRLAAPLRRESYLHLLARGDWRALEGVLLGLSGARPDYMRSRFWYSHDRGETVAFLRLNLLGGASAETLFDLKARIERSMDWYGILKEAVLEDFDPETFVRIDPEWRWSLVLESLAILTADWDASLRPIAEWALAQADTQADAGARYVALGLAELLLHRGQRERALALLEGIHDGAAGALRAFALAQAGHWSEAQSAFEAAIKLRQSEVNARKRIFPVSLAWIYPLCLLAQQTPKHLESARNQGNCQ